MSIIDENDAGKKTEKKLRGISVYAFSFYIFIFQVWNMIVGLWAPQGTGMSSVVKSLAGCLYYQSISQSVNQYFKGL